MEIEKFVEDFAAQLEETDCSGINAGTVFRDIEEWSSFAALSIIAMVDEYYHVKLTGDDIRNSKTIQDIFNILKSKL
jgi:acyl carrier protein